MAAKVRVRDVVREMDVQSESFTVYLNRRTGEFLAVSEEEAMIVEGDREDEDLPEWQREAMPKIREALESEDYIALPGRFDIHDWAIMRDFSSSVADPEVSEHLLNAIHGPGAFRNFRVQLRAFGLEDEWYRFRQQALERIAVRWLEENDIPYELGDDNA